MVIFFAVNDWTAIPVPSIMNLTLDLDVINKFVVYFSSVSLGFLSRPGRPRSAVRPRRRDTAGTTTRRWVATFLSRTQSRAVEFRCYK